MTGIELVLEYLPVILRDKITQASKAGGQPLNLQIEEVADIKWFDKDEVSKRIQNNYEGLTEKTGCWDCLLKYYDWMDSKKK